MDNFLVLTCFDSYVYMSFQNSESSLSAMLWLPSGLKWIFLYECVLGNWLAVFQIFYYCAITAFKLSKIKSTYFKLFLCLFSQEISHHFEGIERVKLNISVVTFSLKSRGKNK